MSSPASLIASHLKSLAYLPAAQCSLKTIHICITWEFDGEASSLLQPRPAESTPWGGAPRNTSGQAPGGSQACDTSGSIRLHCSPCPHGASACELNQGKNSGVGCHAVLQGNLLDPGNKLTSLASPALTGGFFTSWATREAPCPHLAFVPPPIQSGSCPSFFQSDGPQMVS